MRKIIFLGLFTSFFLSCSQENSNDQETKIKNLSFYGDTISEEGSNPTGKLLDLMKGKDSVSLKLEGKILDVCQKKGCWMEMELGPEKSFRVTFKDYAFFVPKDAAGKTAVIEGYAKVDTISISQLKEYASDAGKSKAEIDAINEPETELSFEARGVIIK